MKHKSLILGFLMLLLVGVGLYGVRATIPDQFWRVVQKGEQMFFQHGNLDNPVDRVTFTPSGQVGVDATDGGDPTPEASALLELKAFDKAVLVTRVATPGSIGNAEDGMIAYFNDTDCFKVFQGSKWSPCFTVASGFRTGEDLDDGDGVLGDVYFDTVSKNIFVHNGVRWTEIGESLVDVGGDYPAGPVDGQIFYNTDEQQLYIYFSGQWVPVQVNFTGLESKKGVCERINYVADRGREIACGNNQFATRVYLQDSAWGAGVDNLLHPEIQALECCEITYEDPNENQPQTATQDPVTAPGLIPIVNGPRTRGVELSNYIAGKLYPDQANSPVDFDGNGIVHFGTDFILVQAVLEGKSDGQLEELRQQGTDEIPASTKSGADIRADIEAALAVPGPGGLITALLDIDGAGDGYTARDQVVMLAYSLGDRGDDLQDDYDGTNPTPF